MRVQNGMFQLNKGISFINPHILYEYEIHETQVIIKALYREGIHADKLNGTILTYTISSVSSAVFRVNIRHHSASKKKGLKYIDNNPAIPLFVTDSGNELRVDNGTVSVIFSKDPWGYQFVRNKDNPSVKTTASNTYSSGVITDENGNKYITEKLSLNVGEFVYGLGERFGPYIKNGQHITAWNTDAATESDLGYKNIPFYVTNRGNGVFVNYTGKSDFEVATEDNNAIRFSVEGNELDYFFIQTQSIKETLSIYSNLCGLPAKIPRWSLGLWLSTSFTTEYNEEIVLNQIEKMKDSGIPISVFHFDCFWMKERHWCNFLWNSDAFPRPAEMIKRIKKMGIRICLWINPYISELSEIYKEAEENGYLLKHPDGSPYQIDWWQPGNSFVDFSNPNACEWYKKKLRALLDMGVDTFKTDFGESAPKDAVYYNGISGKLMHNRYTILYNKTVFSLLEEYHGKQNAIVFARSCAPGGQRYPVHWGGDSQANFSSMAGQLRGGLSFGLSGGAFWSHDIGGFFGKPNAAVYKRWIAFGLLSSHSRLHGNESYRVPWNYDEESVDVLRFFKRLRQSLLPYLVGVCNEASRTGVPVLRSMIIEFPENDLCCHLDRQYMLGPSILVAPVFASNGEVGYYLPPGKWTNLLTNEPREGGRWLKETHTVFSLPLYVRENSIIPRCDEDNNPDGTEYKGISIDLYQISNKTGFRFELKEEIELTAEKKAEQIELSSSKPISAAVRCMPSGSSATLNNESKIVL